MTLPELTRGTLSVLGPNDVMLLGGYHNADERARYYKVMDDFEAGAPDCVFHPCWKDKPAVDAGKDAIASAYVRQNGKALIVVGNRAEQARDVTLRLDAQRVGSHAQAVDAQTKETFPIKDNVLTVPIGRHDYRQLLLTEK